MAWKKLITEDDFGGFANPSATIGGAAVNGTATTAMRSDGAPALGPLTRDLDFASGEAANFRSSRLRGGSQLRLRGGSQLPQFSAPWPPSGASR